MMPIFIAGDAYEGLRGKGIGKCWEISEKGEEEGGSIV